MDDPPVTLLLGSEAYAYAIAAAKAQALRGRNVTVSHGLAESLAQLAAEPPEFSEQVENFIDGLVSHLVLDDGKLVVAHAGLRADMQGRASGAVRSFAALR